MKSLNILIPQRMKGNRLDSSLSEMLPSLSRSNISSMIKVGDALINGKKFYFEGKVEGVILKEKNGIRGFGYDPIFRPNGYDETFAQMSIELKNKISHRGLAVKKLVTFLNQDASVL